VKDDALYQQIFMRIISMLINEAVEAKRLGVANDEDIELAMQKGVNYPKGLLAWGKEIGYAKISETLQDLYEEYQEERYRQSPLLRENYKMKFFPEKSEELKSSKIIEEVLLNIKNNTEISSLTMRRSDKFQGKYR
jgi:3-hydroxyacyl-CoA dehydrogenase